MLDVVIEQSSFWGEQVLQNSMHIKCTMIRVLKLLNILTSVEPASKYMLKRHFTLA